MNIFVVKGGFSKEREISLRTGNAVEEALNELHYPFWSFDLKQDNLFEMIETIKKLKPDLIFNALHGKFGEDGKIQAILDYFTIPYTHSGFTASCLGMDKVKSRLLFQKAGIPTPDFRVMTWDQLEEKDPFPKPYIIKPIAEGSSLGVFFIQTKQDLKEARQNWDFGDFLLIEPYLHGKEIHIGVLDDEILGSIEVASNREILDYNGKYTKGESKRRTPAFLTDLEEKQVFEYARKAHDILGCRGVTRPEFIYANGQFYLLEINTQPGLTKTSFIPAIAEGKEISFSALIERILKNSLKNMANVNQKLRQKNYLML